MAGKIFNSRCLHSFYSKLFVALPRLKENFGKLKSGNRILSKLLFDWFKLNSRGQRAGASAFITLALSWLGYTDLVLIANAEYQPPGELRKKFNFIADVVDKVASAVVYIEVKNLGRVFNLLPPNGSGFIIGDDGLILTNAHVVMNRLSSTVLVKLQDGRTFNGRVEDIDVKSDLATVRIEAKNLPIMRLGSSSDIRPGEWVVAIGSPLSLSNTITSGVISSAHRQSSEIGIRNREMEYIQTDASITFGNSGGPLVNLDGEAIGINCMKIAGGISFAIPIDYAKDFLKRTEEKRSQKYSQIGKVKYAGVTVFSLTPSLLREMRVDEYHMPEEIKNGLLVGKVVLGSPAYLSGLKPGDVVTHINSSAVEDVNTIYKALETGKPLKMRILRNGSFKDIFILPEDV